MLLSNLNLLATAPGGVSRLRELILTLAVQGKLVPQDPEDEPASALLKRIRAEKDRLIAEGKIKRDKPLAEVAAEEKPFGLPKGWESVRLPEVTYNLGQGAPTEKFTYIDVASIDNEKGLVTAAAETVEAVDAPSRARKNVAVGTVLYSTIRPYLKNIAVVEKDYTHKAIASTAFAIMHPHIGLHSKYLLHYLRSAIFTDFVSSKAVGVAYPAINDANFFEGVIAIPPTKEQSRIVTRVEELMSLCDALEAKGQLEATQHAQLVTTLLATLTDSETPAQLTESWHRIATHFDLLLDRPEAIETLEQTILQLAVRGLLVPQDPQDEPASELLKKIRGEKEKVILDGKIKRDKPLSPIAENKQPFALPSKWEWVRMEEAFDVRDGTHDTPKYVGQDGIPLITSRNFEAGKICFEGAKLISQADHELIMRRSRVERHDILYSMIGGNIGNQVLVDTDREFSIKNVALFKYVSRTYTLPLYLNLFLETVTLSLQSRAVGGAQPFVSLSLLRNIPFPLPPCAEQSRIVTRVAQLRRLCADLRQRLSASQSTQAHLAEALIQEGA